MPPGGRRCASFLVIGGCSPSGGGVSPDAAAEDAAACPCPCPLRRMRRTALAQRQAVVDAEHDDDGGRIFRRQHVLDRLRPVRRVGPRIVAHETGIRSGLAHDANLRRVSERFLETVGEPIGKRIADNDHRLGRRRFHLARWWRPHGLDGLLLLRPRIKRIVRIVEAAAASSAPAAPKRTAKEFAKLHGLRARALIESGAAAGELRMHRCGERHARGDRRKRQ